MGLRNSQLTRGIIKAGQFLGGRRELVKTITANYTLKASDSGLLILVATADLVVTVPATVKGYVFKLALAAAGLSTGTGLQISPNANDQFVGNGFTPADNKDAILAGASDRAGDLLEFEGDGNVGYYITTVIGTWSREA